ncbi:Cyclic pyranopterin monophosphate synthase [compost metagenome]
MKSLQNSINSRLELTILPTEKCNFRCVYCYEDFAIGRMKPPTIAGIKALVRRRIENHGLKQLRIEWFGGEPLLAKNVVIDLSREFHSHLKSGALEELDCSMTTNGYELTPDLLGELVGLGLNFYQISLDGESERHNATRKYASGEGTFEKIYANLLAARETSLDFTMMLRLHIMPGNEKSLYALAERLKMDFPGDSRFTIFLRDISNLGGTGSKLEVISHAEAVRISKTLQNTFAEAGFKVENGVENEFESQVSISGLSTDNPSLKSMQESPLRVSHVCYAAKPNHLLIRADGRLGKCTVALSSSGNVVGSIAEDGRVNLDPGKMQFWTRGFLSGDAVELGCPLMTKSA